MKFLEDLTILAAIPKSKLKAKAPGHGTATLEFSIDLKQRPPGAYGSAASMEEVLAVMPKSILKAFNAMGGNKGAIRTDFGLIVESQNVEARMAPDLKKANLRLEDVDLTDFRLEMYDPKNSGIALYFSVTTKLSKDVGDFIVTNLGACVFLRIEECQQELHDKDAPKVAHA